MEYALQKEKDTGRGRNPALIIRRPNSHEEYAVVKAGFLIELLITLDLLKLNK
jgi:hypothetical protein